MSIGGSKSSGSSSSTRTLTPTELKLIETQDENLQVLTKIAQESYDLSAEDRDYYERVFREGSDTEAKEAVAKLKSTITGQEVNAEDIENVNIDTLLRDTILNSTPEFQAAATSYIDNASKLTSDYGQESSGLSSSFASGIKDLTNNYSQELETIKSNVGTIDKTILARETGAAQSGISTAYAESRKQMTADLARRGIAGSGVEANLLAGSYQNEAMSKVQAATQARTTALEQSEAMRTQQAGIAGLQAQAGTSGLQTAYQAELSNAQNIYGVVSAQDFQNYQTQNSATLQGISGLTQVAQAGTGVYAGSQNYLSQGTSAASSAASTAGSTAVGLDMQSSTTSKSKTSQWGVDVGKAVGGISSMMGASDVRLKNNIVLLDTINGVNIYEWEWNDLAKEFMSEYLYEPIGVIAQEIIFTKPEAVKTLDIGYLVVDYSLIPEVKEYKDAK